MNKTLKKYPYHFLNYDLPFPPYPPSRPYLPYQLIIKEPEYDLTPHRKK